MNKQLSLIAAVLLLAGSMAYAAGNYNYTENKIAPSFQPEYYNSPTVSGKQTLKGSVVTVPAGQAFPAVATMPISSATLNLGQNVTLALGSDFYYTRRKKPSDKADVRSGRT